jgi:hypothetical protein
MVTVKYSELLSEYIKNSGLSLGEISQQLANKGISADRSYLSKLKNGMKPPASDNLNYAIAEITDGDGDKLLFYAYLDKIPDNIKKYFHGVETDIASFEEQELIDNYRNLNLKERKAILTLIKELN